MHGVIQTFLLAMTPIGELRAAIPVALVVYKQHLVFAYFVSLLGNLVPPLLILIFLEPVCGFFSTRFKICAKFFNWLFSRTRNRAGKRLKKYGPFALTLFVAVPLPITGAWTGSLIAYLFKIPFKRAFPAIALGVGIAGVIVTMAAKAGIAIEHYFGWPTLLGVIFLAIAVSVLKFKIKNLKFNKN